MAEDLSKKVQHWIVIELGGHGGRVVEVDGKRYYDTQKTISSLQVSRGLFGKLVERGVVTPTFYDEFHRKKPYFAEEEILEAMENRFGRIDKA